MNAEPGNSKSGGAALLIVGHNYRVRAGTRWAIGQGFVAGEELVLKQVWYSRYDSSDVYSFETKDGRQKDYFFDRESEDWVEIFEEL